MNLDIFLVSNQFSPLRTFSQTNKYKNILCCVFQNTKKRSAIKLLPWKSLSNPSMSIFHAGINFLWFILAGVGVGIRSLFQQLRVSLASKDIQDRLHLKSMIISRWETLILTMRLACIHPKRRKLESHSPPAVVDHNESPMSACSCPTATSSVTRNNISVHLKKGWQGHGAEFSKAWCSSTRKQTKQTWMCGQRSSVTLTLFSWRDFVKNKKTVCLKNPSRITPLQSSPLQCKLRLVFSPQFFPFFMSCDCTSYIVLLVIALPMKNYSSSTLIASLNFLWCALMATLIVQVSCPFLQGLQWWLLQEYNDLSFEIFLHMSSSPKVQDAGS